MPVIICRNNQRYRVYLRRVTMDSIGRICRLIIRTYPYFGLIYSYSISEICNRRGTYCVRYYYCTRGIRMIIMLIIASFGGLLPLYTQFIYIYISNF